MDFARSIFEGDGSGHDFDHTLRVYHMAVRIAAEEGAEADTVALAALLHDVDDHKLSPATCEHKDRAVGFLRSRGVGEEQIRRIVEIISQVSFSAGNGCPSTLEGRCVQDADRLDAIGAIGIGRAFAFGSSRGRRIYDPEDVDKTATVEHFYDKLFKLKDLMTTETGKTLARQRDEFMHSFLEQFYAEAVGHR